MLKIILVLLPANSTHMIQPLDVAVFRPFKTVLKEKMESYMIEKCLTSFSKKDSITIALNSWVNATVKSKSNIKSGFEASGIWSVASGQWHSRPCSDAGGSTIVVELTTPASLAQHGLFCMRM